MLILKYMKIEKKNINRGGMVHLILAHSYLVFMGAIVLGVFLDTYLVKKMFSSSIYQYIGVFMLLISSIIIYWAQRSTSKGA